VQNRHEAKTMSGRAVQVDARPLPLDVFGRKAEGGNGRPNADAAITYFPRRPDSGVLSESIPLFFIGRNARGFWVAREAEGRTGGVFLSKRSAVRFANRNSAPAGCATMFLNDRLELDVENQGSLIVAWLIGTASRVSSLIPKYPPPIAIRRQKLEKGGWR
jgi:hypothetical protein